jgi:hypothetical protein
VERWLAAAPRSPAGALVRLLQHHWALMFFIFSNRLGCLGSIAATILGSLVLIALMRGCSASPGVFW